MKPVTALEARHCYYSHFTDRDIEVKVNWPKAMQLGSSKAKTDPTQQEARIPVLEHYAMSQPPAKVWECACVYACVQVWADTGGGWPV